MYSDKITLFNRKADTWYATILSGVDLNADKAAMVEKYGATSKDKALLHVKYTMQGGGVVVGGSTYLPPKEWQAAQSGITFQEGDFFWAGEWTGAATISDDAYTIDGFYDYMNANYDGVYIISSVAMYSVIPHFEIVGK